MSRELTVREQAACIWWGNTIALAVEDDHAESRQQLEEATGMSGDQFWKSLHGMAIEDGDPAQGWAEVVSRFLVQRDHIDAVRPGPGDADYDRVLGLLTEAMTRLARGMLAGNPLCLPR